MRVRFDIVKMKIFQDSYVRPGCLAGSAASGTTGSTTSLASEGEVSMMMMMMMMIMVMMMMHCNYNYGNGEGGDGEDSAV